MARNGAILLLESLKSKSLKSAISYGYPFPLASIPTTTPIHILIPFLCNILVYAAASLSRIHYTALSGPPSKESGGRWRRSFERGRRVIENNCRLRKCVSNPSYSFDRTDKLHGYVHFSFLFVLSSSLSLTLFEEMNFIESNFTYGFLFVRGLNENEKSFPSFVLLLCVLMGWGLNVEKHDR